MTMDDLISNGHILLLGGSETTATLLSGVTYLLLTNRSALEQLTREVRSSFKSEKEITITSVGTLAYMLACLNEALRIYPPVATGLPRKVPNGGAVIGDSFVPEQVSTFSFLFLISLCL
jgi:cytochrome P450